MRSLICSSKYILVFLALAALTGCTELSPAAADNDTSADASTKPEAAYYYITRLPDRSYVQTYGDSDNPRPWYTAAEALGEIGKPAIPALMERLDTADPYELKLALYALMLASQDTALQAETDGDYLQLDTVLTEDNNAENRQRALAWWERHRHLWP